MKYSDVQILAMMVWDVVHECPQQCALRAFNVTFKSQLRLQLEGSQFEVYVTF